MIRSMTGYGKAELETASGRFVVEIRSVNHRYGEIGIKLPRLLYVFENSVKRQVGERLKRGKIDVLIQYEQPEAGALMPRLNLPLARAYADALAVLRDELRINAEVPLALIASQRDVLVSAEADELPPGLGEDLLRVVATATDRHEEMRLTEGEMLHHDFLARRDVLETLISVVRQRAPHVSRELADKLRDRLAQLLGEQPVDPARLAQEVALLADRCDISEELVRFGSHLAQFDDMMKSPDPVGRKLDFLLQEMNREVNTIGSKANDSTLAQVVIDLKAELEKIREQVQNIE
jgi:uncharacterized protein (TIGR00255 family)